MNKGTKRARMRSARELSDRFHLCFLLSSLAPTRHSLHRPLASLDARRLNICLFSGRADCESPARPSQLTLVGSDSLSIMYRIYLTYIHFLDPTQTSVITETEAGILSTRACHLEMIYTGPGPTILILHGELPLRGCGEKEARMDVG